MLILSLDTSSKTASCALVSEDGIIAESFLNAKITHSATVMPMIEGLFKNSGRNISDVTMFAATNGPGSFTGVRIGASILLGLAFGKNAPCVGLSTLEVIASPLCRLYPGEIICPVLDARRGQFYNALFKDGNRLTPDRAVSADELDAELKNTGGPAIICGDGYLIAKEKLSCDMIIPPARLIYPSAAEAAYLSVSVYDKAEDKTVFSNKNFKPVYLRPSQAERVKNNNANL